MATYNSSHTDAQIDAAVEKFNKCRNRITVIAPTGSYVTASCGGTTLTSIEYYLDGTNGLFYFYFDKYGDWSVNATNGTDAYSEIIQIYEVKDYVVNLAGASPITVSETLSENSWATIQAVAQASEGSSYWSIGDRKAVTLNGTVGSGITFSNATYYAFIIGFDHNSTFEGVGIHFELAYSAATDGANIAFLDSKYEYTITSSSDYNKYFAMMNYDDIVYWYNSPMRTYILGNDTESTTTFFNALPDELKASMKKVDKYSAYQNTSPVMQPTQDYLFLLSLYELNGTKGNVDYTESNYQQKYAFYENSNNRKKYKYNATTTMCSYYWTRTKRTRYTNVDNYDKDYVAIRPSDIGTSGDVVYYVDGNYVYAISPAFVIG